MERKTVKLDPIYRYIKWREFFMRAKPYEVYIIDPHRKDREEFIEALKQLHDRYGLVHFHHDFSTFMRIDPLQHINETLEFLQDPEVSEKVSASYGDFYTRELTPAAMEEKRKAAASMNPIGHNVPGFVSEPKLEPQSNDLPLSGTLGHPEQNNLFMSLKRAATENPKEFKEAIEKFEHKTKKEDDCEF